MNLKEILENKKGVLAKVRGILWWIYDQRNSLKEFFRRKTKKYQRILGFKNKPDNSYHFAIVCVKRPAYAKLAIENVNSLHCINPTHLFTIYCDSACEDFLKKNLRKFDYPKDVTINNAFGVADKPWQYYKLETAIEISREDWLLVDADARWHHDPIIDRSKITFLVSPKMIREKPDETLVIKNVFGREDWLGFRYYSSGFLSIPSRFMTDKVANDSRTLLKKLLDSKFEFLPSQGQRDDQKRQAEQFALNLGILSNHAESNLTTLKKKDGTKDTNLLQSLYYGCARQINE